MSSYLVVDGSVEQSLRLLASQLAKRAPDYAKLVVVGFTWPHGFAAHQFSAIEERRTATKPVRVRTIWLNRLAKSKLCVQLLTLRNQLPRYQS